MDKLGWRDVAEQLSSSQLQDVPRGALSRLAQDPAADGSRGLFADALRLRDARDARERRAILDVL